ncbi:MAG: YceI family protein [Verrucomicrobiota bacterium]
MTSSKTILSALCAAALQITAFAAPDSFDIDAAHSTVGFKIQHLFSHVTGRFNALTGRIVMDFEKPASSSVNVTIQMASIDTANEMRDKHLRGPDFFDVTKFPAMTFASKAIKQTGPDTAEIIGDLTMHGVTKEVPLTVHYLGKGPGMQGETRGGWEATAKLKRSEFGLAWGKVIEGTQAVGDEVAINLEIEGVKKP